MQEKILVIDDDPAIGTVIEAAGAALGYKVVTAYDGTSGLRAAEQEGISLIIIDYSLPDRTGFDLCQAIRQANSKVLVMFLTSRSDEDDRISGLELGADDYVTKPFSVRELVARIKALLKRRVSTDAQTTEGKEEEQIRYRELLIDLKKRKAYMSGQLLDLTASEFDILAFLAKHPGCPYSREELIQELWGYSAKGYETNITAHLCRLRKKIEQDINKTEYIHTMRGRGYSFGE